MRQALQNGSFGPPTSPFLPVPAAIAVDDMAVFAAVDAAAASANLQQKGWMEDST
jgi:hypothetical protein